MADRSSDARPSPACPQTHQLLLPFGDIEEKRPPTREKVFREGFRVRVSEKGVLIEALEYHTRPLLLQGEALSELGLTLQRDDERVAKD